MALQIVSAAQELEVSCLRVLLWGQPGAGKTSLGCTADRVLCFDTDQGSHRSAFRQDIVAVKSWEEISNVTPKDLEGYDTIMVDTVGRQLDLISAYLISTNPKFGQRDGSMTLKGYGAMKAIFTVWCRRLSLFGKDIIFVAHDKEDKRGDDVVARPDIQGGSYGEVFKLCDGIGYLHMVGGDRVLDFSPHEGWVGKNPAMLPTLKVPDFHQEGTFFSNLLADIKASLGHVAGASQKMLKKLDTLRDKLEKCENAKQCQAALTAINKADEPYKSQAKRLLNERFKDLPHVEWDTTELKFIDIKTEDVTDEELAV